MEREARGAVAGYAVTVFVSSALLMVLEIVAGRLIAPYVGVSLYTWTSIIGVILAGLSLGNWLGGIWADRGGDERAAGLTLGLAGLFAIAILLLLTLVAPAIQASGVSLLGASLIYIGALFFVPALLLGVVTPLLTTLALRRDPRAGHVVGRMHALAALGSIVGTFVTGFGLVQYLGVVSIIVGVSVTLFLLALPFLRTRRTLPVLGALLFGAGLVAMAAHARQGFDSPCEVESDYFCIRVVEESVPGDRVRTMVLDHLVHGSNVESQPELLIAPYVHLMDELAGTYFDEERRRGLRYFFVGGGAYTLPRALRAHYPEARIVVAELDPQVTAVARERLFVAPQTLEVVHADARTALARWPSGAFDVIYGDAFHDVSIPYHLVTREYAQLVRSRLAADGLYVINVVDAFPDPRLVKAMVKTLASVFRHVDVWIDEVPPVPARITLVISATDAGPAPEVVRAARGFPRHWVAVTEPLLGSGTPLAALPLLTDDFAPVERLVADLLLGELGV